ncbi:hypothetical protein FHT67_002582 [Paenibacillus sp. BK720]|nr:hypothetical protein [Paenibacillus sp. BK720]
MELARISLQLQIRMVITKLLLGKLKRYRLRLALLDSQLPEALQLLQRADNLADNIAYVQLDNLFACGSPGVGYVNRLFA